MIRVVEASTGKEAFIEELTGRDARVAARQDAMANCYVCDVPLRKKARDDHHFPITRGHVKDGYFDKAETTIPLCKACHDMVHMPVDQWSYDWFFRAMSQMGREGKLWFLKLVATTFERQKVMFVLERLDEIAKERREAAGDRYPMDFWW